MRLGTFDHSELGQEPRTITFQLHTRDVSIVDVTFPPNTDLDTHQHESAYLCLVIQGEYEEWARRHHTVIWASSEHDYYEGSEHAVRIGPTGVRMLHVTDPLRLGWRGEQSPLRLGLLWQIARAISHEDCQDDADLLHLESLAFELRGRAAIGARTPAWLPRALAHIRGGYARSVGLSELAAEAGVHRSHFARSFKHHHGITPGEYQRRIRVAAALRRLTDMDTTLSRVAIDTGFADQSHMGKYFRRYFGCTPSAAQEYLRSGGRKTELPS